MKITFPKFDSKQHPRNLRWVKLYDKTRTETLRLILLNGLVIGIIWKSKGKYSESFVAWCSYRVKPFTFRSPLNVVLTNPSETSLMRMAARKIHFDMREMRKFQLAVLGEEKSSSIDQKSE